MFLFAPIGNGIRLRRWPVATLLLAALQLGAGIATLPDIRRVRAERAEATLPIPRGTPVAELRAAHAAAALAQERALEASDPVHQWGLDPASPAWRALSALFLHADALHLAGNLGALLLLGLFVEQAWGPIAVIVLSLGGGALALFLDASAGTPGTLAGSSAAVAVLLGAYLVLFGGRPIRFGWVYLEYLRPFYGRIGLPATALGGLWIALQLVGLALGVCCVETGIAYLSHLAGFAFGALAARLIPARLA